VNTRGRTPEHLGRVKYGLLPITSRDPIFQKETPAFEADFTFAGTLFEFKY
jgi:hypothetical protein